ncbi:hypothetical protein D3C80_1689950 [compost metagenome]
MSDDRRINARLKPSSRPKNIPPRLRTTVKYAPLSRKGADSIASWKASSIIE